MPFLSHCVCFSPYRFDGISGGKRGWFPSNLTVTPNDSGDVANFTTSLSSNASLISNTSADSTILYPTTSMAIPLLAKDGKIARSTSSNENTAAIDISMTQENSSSNIQTPTSLSSSYSHIQCSSSPRCSSPVLIASLKKEKSPKFRRMQQSHTIITPLEQLDRPCDNQNSYFPTTPVGLATVLVQQSPLAHSLTTFNLEMNSNLSAAIQAAKVPSESTELDELKGLKEALKLVMNTKNTKIALSATAPSPPTTFNHTKGLKQSAIVGNARGEPVFGISVDAEGQNKLRSNESDLGVKFATPSPPPYSITTPSPSFVLSDSPMDNDCVAENNVQHAASDLACPTNESVSARDLIGVVSLLEKRVEELTVYSTSHCDSPRCRVLDGRENTMAVLSLTKLLVDDSMKLFQLLEIHELPHLRISLSQAFARLVDAATDFSSNLTDLLGHLHTVSILLNILRRRLPSLNQARVLRGGKHSILKGVCGPAAVNSNLRLSLDLPRGKKPLFPHKPPQNATSLRSLSSALSIASFQFSSQSSSGSKDLHVVKETVKGGTVKALTRYSLQNLASEFTRAFITTYSTFLDYAQLLDLLVEETNGPWMIERIGMDFSASQSPIMRCQSCHDSRHTIHAHPRPCLSSPSRPTSSFSVTTTATTDQRHHSHTLLPSNSASLSVSPFFLGNTSGPRSFPFSVSHSAMDEAPSDSSAHSLLPEQLHHSLILKKGFSHQQNVRHSTPSIMPSHHSTCPSSLTLLVWDVVEVARNLTLIDHSLLSRINSHECLDKYWSTHEHSNIRSMIRFANEVYFDYSVGCDFDFGGRFFVFLFFLVDFCCDSHVNFYCFVACSTISLLFPRTQPLQTP